jgi:pantoate--beta-alanine ligase
MKIIKKSNTINKILEKYHNVGFVPTMGTLHEGHISLIRKSKKESFKTVVSIFINPKQFTKQKDFENYPKKIKEDIKICKKNNVDYLFLPSFSEIYDWGSGKKAYPKIKNIMEQKFRKNHFKGVLDVIAKLFSIIKNTKVYMGEKDYQQLHVVRQFCKINKIQSEIIACKTIRSKEGYALSSRNLLLSKDFHQIMKSVYKKMHRYKSQNLNKAFNRSFLKKDIKKAGVEKIDYIDLVNLQTFSKVRKISKKTNIFIAYYLNGVRLIDNI